MAADSNRSNFPTSFEKLKQLLACPACYGELRLDESASQQVGESATQQGDRLPKRLVCTKCGRAYAIVGDIPELIAGRD